MKQIALKVLRWAFRIIVIGVVLINMAQFCGYILPSMDTLSTHQEQLIIVNDYSAPSNNYWEPSKNKSTCVLPVGYPHGPPGWKRLLRICANLDQFSIPCRSNQTCIECIAPWGCSHAWIQKFVKQFITYENEAREKRRNELRNIIRNKFQLENKQKPIILMTLNNGYIYLFLNWVCSLEAQGIADSVRKQTIIIVTDEKAEAMARKAGFEVATTDWVKDIDIEQEAAESYALGAHRWTVSLQIVYTFDLIHLGYDVIQQDVDVAWLADVRSYFHRHIDFDIAMACDGRLDYIGPGNSGFIYVESNCKTKVFLDTLVFYIGLVIHARSDQVAWNMFLTSYDFRQIVYKMLPPDMFVGGDSFGNADRKPKVSDHVLFLHASWTFDHAEKVTKFKSINAWFFNEQCPWYDKSLIPKHEEPKKYLLPKDRTWTWPDPKQDAWWTSHGQPHPFDVKILQSD
eukprot:45843_1